MTDTRQQKAAATRTTRTCRAEAIATMIAIVLALLLPTEVLAQQQRETFKDANGRTLGWSTSNGRGDTTYYDAAGRNTGRSVTRGSTTTVYDNMGRQTGTIRRK